MPEQAPGTMGVIYRVPLSQLHPHPKNPFDVRDDPAMQELTESVQKSGVRVPAIARPRGDGSYELISGHRRKHACERSGLDSMPVIVLELDDDAAIIQLVDSNIQRENILPSERAIINRYLQQHPDIMVVENYIDNGCTGTNFNRPGFQRMLSDIEDGRINCVVVKDLSRLGRNSIDTGYYIEQYFRMKNVRFIAVNEQFDTADPESASMGILLPLRNMINEAYSLDIGRKIKAQQRQAMRIWLMDFLPRLQCAPSS